MPAAHARLHRLGGAGLLLGERPQPARHRRDRHERGRCEDDRRHDRKRGRLRRLRFASSSPTVANTHDMQSEEQDEQIAATNFAAFVCSEKPTRNPTPTISTITNTFRNRSAIVRPVSTAERAIDRNRSSKPLCTSVAILDLLIWSVEADGERKE
jgi:hypothetical protein